MFKAAPELQAQESIVKGYFFEHSGQQETFIAIDTPKYALTHNMNTPKYLLSLMFSILYLFATGQQIDSAFYNKRIKDTAVYVKSIVTNKEQYKNKELGVLLNDLKIKVKSFLMLNSKFGEYHAVILFFDDYKTSVKKMEQIGGLKRPSVLPIRFKTPIPIFKHLEIILHSIQKNDWEKPVEEFYSKQIVENIN